MEKEMENRIHEESAMARKMIDAVIPPPGEDGFVHIDAVGVCRAAIRAAALLAYKAPPPERAVIVASLQASLANLVESAVREDPLGDAHTVMLDPPMPEEKENRPGTKMGNAMFALGIGMSPRTADGTPVYSTQEMVGAAQRVIAMALYDTPGADDETRQLLCCQICGELNERIQEARVEKPVPNVETIHTDSKESGKKH